VAGSATLLCIFVATLAGYGITRFRFWGRETFAATALFTYMMALIMIVVPFFILMRGLCIGLYPELPADSVAVAARARHGAGGARRFDDKRRD
jgi:ABC-type glycerol-3-phosphate transport system permease component